MKAEADDVRTVPYAGETLKRALSIQPEIYSASI